MKQPRLSISEFTEQVTEIMPAIMRELYKRESGKCCKMHITIPQLVVLDILTRDGESRMSDLARAINVTTAAITGTVDRLVRDGYVTRENDARDRRIIKVRPTSKGARIGKDAVKERKAVISKMFGVISQAEREEYLRILIIIRDRLKTDKD
jgi:DNA-binding MarR family transcriptional regulator